MRNSRFIFIFLLLTLIHSAFAQLKTEQGYFTLKMPVKMMEFDQSNSKYVPFDDKILATKKIQIDKDGLVVGVSKDDTKFIYFMDAQGTTYIHPEKSRENRTAFHSSFNGGGAAASAGELHIVNGQITKIDVSSGHYLPTLFEVLQLVESLDEMGADLSKAHIFGDWNHHIEVSLEECRNLNRGISEFFKNPKASQSVIQKMFYDHPKLVVRLLQISVSETERFSFEKRSEFFSVLNEVWNGYEQATKQGEIGFAFRKTTLYNPLFEVLKRGDEKEYMKTFEEVLRLGEKYDSLLMKTLLNDFFEYAYNDRKSVAHFTTYKNQEWLNPVLQRIVQDEKLFSKTKTAVEENEYFVKLLKKANRKQKIKDICSIFFKK